MGIAFQKAVACVLRGSAEAAELLVFRHPTAGEQIPKGTLEADESPEVAVFRELAEESGITDAKLIRSLGHEDRSVGVTSREIAPGAIHRWHLFWLESTTELPDTFDHVAQGNSDEQGLVFRFRWVALERAHHTLHPAFHNVCARLMRAIRGGE